MTVTFTKDKETKNTVRFTAARGSDISGSLYVAKDSLLLQEDQTFLDLYMWQKTVRLPTKTN
jgi:hypothetical protein